MQRFLTFFIGLLISVSAAGQDALLRVQERAKYLNDFKALLQSDDAVVRQAAIEEALQTDDLQLRTMALETSMGSGDELLQTNAIRWYVNERSQIPVTLVLPERPSEAQRWIYKTWNPLILKNIQVIGQDEVTFKTVGSQGGQLIRGGMELRYAYSGVGCTMTLRPAGGTALAGQFFCNFGGRASSFGGGDDTAALVARVDLS